jgi:outer membrane protein TolC
MTARWILAIGALLGVAPALIGAARAADPTEASAGVQPAAEVKEVDLDRIRAAIDRVRPAGPEPVTIPPLEASEIRRISLHEAVEVALRHNIDLQIATLDRDAAAHEVPATRAKFHPTPGFDFVATGEEIQDRVERDEGGGIVVSEGKQNIDTQDGRFFLRQELPTGATLELSTDVFREEVSGEDDTNSAGFEVGLRQPLMRGGRIYVARREILNAGYDLTIEEAKLESDILRVVADTKISYNNTILARRLIDVVLAAIERDRRLIEASRELYQAARASRRDVVSAEIQLANDLARLAARRADLGRAQLELRDVLGLPIAESVLPADEIVRFEPVEFRLGHWISRALADRPEIREIVTRLERADLDLKVARNDVLPRLDLLGQYRRSDNEPSFQNAYNLDNGRWLAGVAFEIPFGNVAARERYTIAEIQYRRVNRELENQRREIELEVRGEEILLERSLEDLRAQAEIVEKSRQKLEIAVERYRLGIANNLDVTDAQEELLNSEENLLSAIVAYNNGLARLEASIAGPL